jgi:hypothetical protein
MTDPLRTNWDDSEDFYAADQNEINEKINRSLNLARPTWATLPRYMTGSTFTAATGELYLGYFQAGETGAAATIHTYCGSTTASGLTKCRFAVYSEDDDGDLTLIGSTANDTSQFGTQFGGVSKALQSLASIVQGEMYALGVLFVGTTPPDIGGVFGNQAELSVDHRLNGILTGQADLPSTISAGSINQDYRVVSLRLAA